MKSFSVLTVLLSVGIAHATTNSPVARDLASEIWDDIKNAATCTACQAVLGVLKGVNDLGQTVFVDTLTEVCKLSGAEDDDVCEGIIAREGPVLGYILSQLSLGSDSSNALCASAFGLCPYPAVRNYTLTFPEPKPDTTRPAASGQSPIQVVHISDTHVDLSYETGSSWNCTKPICCRSYDASDAPGNSTTPSGPYGNTKCDAPISLEESMFASIKALNPAPAFSIYTGDVVAHDLWDVTEDEVLTDLSATYNRMVDIGKVFATIGNHDAAPVNDLPLASVPSQYSANWTYQALAANFSALTEDSSVVPVANQYGSYSSVFTGSHGVDLKVISYNSIFYYIDNFFAFLDPMPYDPDGQFAWLIDELQAAETAGQRAWLIAHVPTGSSDHFHDYSHYFNDIVERYEATIAAVFFGHTHEDQFQLWYSDYSAQTADTATAMGYIAPSLTPTSGPGTYRVYDIDPVTFGVLDFTNYIANISDPAYQNGPSWIKYYSAKETYGPLVSPPVTDSAAELTPAFWHNVTEVLETDDEQFTAYISRQTRGWNVANCTGSCQNTTICGIRGGDAQYNCVVPKIGFDFTKRGDGESSQAPQTSKCEDGGMASLFRRFVAAGNQ